MTRVGEVPRLGSCLGDRGSAGVTDPGLFADGIQDLGHGREVIALPGNDLAVHLDGQFSSCAVDQLHLDARFPPQGSRQTGGMLSDAASDGALPDDDFFLHGALLS
jgi:hypothetical protein